MTDIAPDTGTDTTETDTSIDSNGDTPNVSSLQAEVDKWRAQARKHEDRAKANAAAAKELEQVKASSMTEQEKAVAEAVAAARAETLADVGGKIARAEIKAAAAGRLPSASLDVLLDGLNLAAFLNDEGDVDAEKVTTFLDGIAPAQQDEELKPGDLLAGLDLGQGARGKTPGLGSTQFERDLRSKLGI